jgi:two-component system response regulator AtoC
MGTRESGSITFEESLAARVPENHIYVETVSPAMRPLEQVMTDIGPTEIPVLLLGDSGTGKDVVALHLQRLSRHRRQSFRKVHCTSVSPEALFLNGASQEGGTLYLDEVAELSSEGQARLLHSLAEGEHSSATPPPVRLICATTRNLEELMRAGRFREELYYRLNGVCLRLPPLRHRREDIPALAEFFLEKFAALLGRPQPVLGARGMNCLLQHSWPGNIRELENAMKKVVVLGGEMAQLLEPGAAPPAAASAMVSLKEAARAASRQAERELILKALTRTRWNRKRAAAELQISYKALLYKLKQIGLEEAAGS